MIRDLIYVNLDKETKKVVSYGIEFREFINALKGLPNNILVLEGQYGTSFDFTTNCEYCSKEDIAEFIKEDVYGYGNFSWVDFDSYSELKKLTKQEVAELFYLSKMWIPVNGTYFTKLNNRFIYTAHDDGWTNNTYYNNLDDYKEVLSNVIIHKVKRLYNLSLPTPNEIATELSALSLEGITIDLMRLSVDEEGIVRIPIFKLGSYTDMDEVYDICREKEIAVDIEMIYSNDRWELKWL